MITADYIKSMITMRDVLTMYGIECSKSPIHCPIHNGKNKKFYFTDKQFICFSKCQEKGDIFNFVMAYEKCDFKQAKKILVDYFCFQDTAEVRKRAEILKEQRAREQAEADRKYRIFLKALDEFVKCDKIILREKPNSPDDVMSIEFIEALRNYELLWERLQEAKWNLS